jgi:hypothetical protein
MAVSLLFGVGKEENGDLIGVMLTVVPVSATKTTAMLSYSTAHAEAVKKALPKLFAASDKRPRCRKTSCKGGKLYAVASVLRRLDGGEESRGVKFFNDCALEPKAPPEGRDLLLF